MTAKKQKFSVKDVHTIFHKHKFTGAAIVMVGLAVTVMSVFATATVSILATGGSAISSTTAANSGNTFTALTGPEISEGTVADIGTGTIILNSPAGFEFDISSVVTGTVVNLGSGCGNPQKLKLAAGASAETATVTATTITITVSQNSSGSCNGKITWSGIKVKPTLATPLASGNITKGGTSTISGITGSTNLGTLTEVTGGADPFVTAGGVSSLTTNGSFKAGVAITVDVNFNEAVTVTGTPQLTLSTGTPATTAVNYSSGSGTTKLSFVYTVAVGNTSADLDYSSTTALALNGGTIKDTLTGTKNAVLTLAAPGAAGSLGANKNIIIDTTVPTLSETTPVNTPTNSTSPAYTFNSSEVGTITYGGGCTGPAGAIVGANAISFGPLAAGSYPSCTVTVTDVALNASTALAVTAFTIDLTAPVLGQVNAVPTPTNDSTPNYTFSVTETTLGITPNITYGGSCSSATNVAVSGDNIITFTTLPDLASPGYTNCTVRVTDKAGNLSSILVVNSFIVDTTAPVLGEVTAVPTPTNDTTPNYTFSSTEAGTISYVGDCSSVTTAAVAGNNTITFNTLTSAPHNNCKLKVIDAATNDSGLLTISNFTVDTTPPPGPTLSQVTAVLSPTNSLTPSYTFSSTPSNGVANMTYTGDCTAISTFPSYNTSPLVPPATTTTNYTITFNTLAVGLHSNCQIQSTDGTGASNILTVNSFTIDTTAPTLGQIATVPTPGSSHTPGYTFSTTENGQMTFGGACSGTPTAQTGLGVVPGNKAVTFASLVDGTYSNCTITVTDAAGNSSSALLVNTFIIDSTTPVLAEVTPVTSPTNIATPVYTFSSNEAGTIAYTGDCSSATTAAIAGNNPVTFNVLASGAHINCKIQVTDVVGNISALLNVSAFSVDIVSPSAIANLGSSSQSNTSIGLTWTATGNDNAVGTASSYNLKYSTSPITDGNFSAATSATGVSIPNIAGSAESYTLTGLTPSTLYYFAIKATDSAGNVSAISNLPSFSTTATPVVAPVVAQQAGAANVGGAGNEACSGLFCTEIVNYKLLTNQAESPKTLIVKVEPPECDRDANTEIPFTDINNDVNGLFIQQLYRKCIVDGRSETKYDPKGFVTRAEYLKTVLKMTNSGVADYHGAFADVQAADWFSKYVQKALDLGLIQLVEKFNPNSHVTRSQALKILLLAKNINGLDEYHSHFNDMNEGDWAYHYAAYSRIIGLFEIKTVEEGKTGKVGQFYSFPRTMKMSDSGKDVRDLKEVLQQMNLFTGELNNFYDRQLGSAVIAFQGSRGLKASGNFDFQTTDKLLKEKLFPRIIRYFLPEKALTRSELAALLVLINR